MVPMKILYLNHNIKGEGTWHRAFNFARELAARGHDMTVMTVSQKNNFKSFSYTEAGVRVIECPKFLTLDGGGWGPMDIAFRKLFVLGEKFDIIHGFDHKPNVYIPSLLGRMAHKGTLMFSDWADWWGRGGINSCGRVKPETLIEDILEEDIRRRADGLTVISMALKERSQKLGIKEEKIFYLPVGCDCARIKPLDAAAQKEIIKKYSLPEGRFIFEFIGYGQIDLGAMMEAFEIIRAKRNDVFFLIVGPPEKHVSEKIAKSAYKDSYRVTGKVAITAVAEYAAVAGAFLLPLKETIANRGRYPTKSGDYLAAGKPVIANPVGDIEHIIKKYGAGVIAEFDPQKIAEKMQLLLDDPGLAAQYGANARKAAQELSWANLAIGLEDFYRAKMAKKNG